MTGNTLMPASFQAGMYLPGMPAPVVTTLTLSSAKSAASSSTCGCIIIRLTPKGLLVLARAMRICSRSWSGE